MVSHLPGCQKIMRNASVSGVTVGRLRKHIWLTLPLRLAPCLRNMLFADGETRIHLPGGSLTLSQLTAMLNTIPLEITFVDIDNVNRYFNEGPKVFKRPGMALDREVFTCHPPKIEEQVRRIIGEFRAGNLDQVPVWMDKGRPDILSDLLRCPG